MKMLWVIPTPIGNISDVSDRMREVLSSVDVLLCESLSKTKLLYKLLEMKPPKLIRYWQKTEQSVIQGLSNLPDSIGLISDAGMPCISDPGYLLVSACYDAGWKVSALPGPSAFVVAVAMSGIACDTFQFMGFLPPKSSACQERLQRLRGLGISGVLYESPRRVVRLCEDVQEVFGENHQVCVLRELSKKFETCYRGPISEVIRQLNQTVIKGEFCIVIDKAVPIPQWHSDAVLLSSYLSTSDAATVCAKMHQVSKTAVYQYLLSYQEKH